MNKVINAVPVEQDQLCQALESKVLELMAERDALAAENAALKTNLMFWDAEDPEIPYDDPSVIASNNEIPTGQEFIVQVAAKMPNRKYRVSRVDDYDCEVELVEDNSVKAPATEAFLNSVRAEGLQRLADAWYAIANESDPGVVISDSLRLRYRQGADDVAAFAEEIRAGKDGE